MMKRNRKNGLYKYVVFALAGCAGCLTVLAQQAPESQPYTPPFDLQKELQIKIDGPFTAVIAGDLNYVHPIAQLSDPSVQDLIKVVRSADVGIANMESNIVDMRNYKGPILGTMGPKEIAADVRSMGFTIVNRANNHTTEGGSEGMFETNSWLDKAGIVYAGAGRNLDEARAPEYVETSKGRVGLVGMYAMSAAADGIVIPATYRFGNVGGLPGLDPIHLTMYQIVTPQQLEELRGIRDSIYAHRLEVPHPVPPIPTDEPKDRLQFSRVGPWFKAGTTPGGLSFSMDPEDERLILRSIRNGKEYSGYMVAVIHTHEDISVLRLGSTSEYPTDFLVELAHKAIDNGADVFVGTGVHFLRSIEIYKGKPIFYGMGSFTYMLNQQVAQLTNYHQRTGNKLEPRRNAVNVDPYTTEMTDAEAQWLDWGANPNFPRMGDEDDMESLLAECKYDKGKLIEIILHPVDLGLDQPTGLRGIPRVPSPELAQKILQKMQRISKPYGTSIEIKGNLGIIRITQDSKQ